MRVATLARAPRLQFRYVRMAIQAVRYVSLLRGDAACCGCTSLQTSTPLYRNAEKPVRLFGNLKEALEIQAPTPRPFCASVHCKGVKSYKSRSPFYGICVQMHSFWANAITVPKAGRLALSKIDTVLPNGWFQLSQFGYARAVKFDVL